MEGPACAADNRKVLVRQIAPGAVVILDNLAAQRSTDAAQALRDYGCWVPNLPPNSLDMTPTEKAYRNLRCHRAICELHDPAER